MRIFTTKWYKLCRWHQPFDFIEGGVEKDVDSHHIYSCGDFNSRTAVRSDYYVNNMLPYSNNDFPFQRFNCGKTVNSFGLELLSPCNKSQIFIMNARFFTDKNIGWFENNGCSTVDYLIATTSNHLHPLQVENCDSDINMIHYIKNKFGKIR